MKLRILTTKLTSLSCKRVASELSKRLGYKVWRSNKEKPFRKHILYGDQKDKIFQYKWFKSKEIPALDFTCNKEEAKQWAAKEVVVARLLTCSSEGKGIVIAETPEQVPLAPVYTKYKKKKKEFRVHIFKNKVVHVLEKRKRSNYTGNGDSRVRNTANGFVFCSDDVVEPAGLRELALKASEVTASDFKGVDIGWNEKKNELFVIEVNSAPGIEGTNVQRYASTIVEVMK